MPAVESRTGYPRTLTELTIQKEKLGFWMHFTAYALVNGLIASMNLIYSPSTIWFIFVLFPWGIGVVAHFIGAYYSTPLKLREKELLAQTNPSGKSPPTA